MTAYRFIGASDYTYYIIASLNEATKAVNEAHDEIVKAAE